MYFYKRPGHKRLGHKRPGHKRPGHKRPATVLLSMNLTFYIIFIFKDTKNVIYIYY